MHLRQIERDHEEVRCGETGRDRLTDLHISGDHDPVHRRANDGVLQVQLCGIQRRLSLFDLRPCHVLLRLSPLGIRHRDVDIVLRHVLLRHQRFHPIQFALALSQIGFGSCDIRFRHFKIAGCLIAAGSEGFRIDHGHDIAGLDHRVEIGVQAFDHAGHLCPNLNQDDRIDRSRRGHERNDGASFDRSAPISHRGFALPVEEDVASNGQPDQQDTNDQDGTTHRLVLQFPLLLGVHCINKAEANHLADRPLYGRLRKNKQAVRRSADGLSDVPGYGSD